RALHAQRAPRGLARVAAGGGLGLRALLGDQHRRRLRLEPAAQARVGWRGADAPHRSRGGIRAPGGGSGVEL
ncbi:MAG: hypothetical protein AVDCRST_MAG45-1442, partial [uncultured Solirubrobacterales bacterium]